MKSERGCVVVIDDNRDNLALLEEILSEYQVVAAGSGHEGISAVKTRVPDLVLLDVQMPDLDGFAVLSKLRADPQLTSIPVVLLTAAYRDPGSISKGFSLGATDYLTKPIQTEELRVRVRAVLEANRVRRELNRLRQDFAAMLLHDIRTPLESVSLAIALLRDNPGRHAELLDMVEGGLAELDDLVEDLVEGYRLGEENASLDRTQVNLRQLANEVTKKLSLAIEQRRCAVLIEIPSRMSISADARVLRRVFLNAVGNALRHAAPCSLKIKAYRVDGAIRIDIEDDGPGLTAESQKRAFDRYYRLGNSRSKQFPLAPVTASHRGFGLGLAFCKQGIEAHGGQIGIESAPASGTRLWILLPANP